MKRYLILLSFIIALVTAEAKTNTHMKVVENKNQQNTETAVLGAGCFWCVEAVFQSLKGVSNVEPGYAGGSTKNPKYTEVVTGRTGHAEVAKVTYNPDVISFEFLLSVFFQTHDPTTLNYQGADRGTQYRSAIFFNSADQKLSAEKIISELNNQQVYPDPIVTEVTELEKFYIAEDYHNDYYLKNQNESYCRYVIQPKMKKFKAVFKDYLK